MNESELDIDDTSGPGADAETGPGADTDTDIDVVLVAAVAENGVIGVDGGMPWHYPADLARFKRTTVGHPVVMGRRTYESIAAQLGGPLPERTNIVLSRGAFERDDDRVVHAGSVDEALAVAREHDDVVFVVGGATVYEQFLPLADRLLLTEIHETYEGDTQFPDVGWESWTEVERERREEFDFVTYERVSRSG